MELVTVKSKYQIVIPQSIRDQAQIGIGDLLEASIEDGKITFTPKVAIDRHLAEALQDVAAGRTHGPYKTVDEAVAALDTRADKHRSHKK